MFTRFGWSLSKFDCITVKELNDYIMRKDLSIFIEENLALLSTNSFVFCAPTFCFHDFALQASFTSAFTLHVQCSEGSEMQWFCFFIKYVLRIRCCICSDQLLFLQDL